MIVSLLQLKNWRNFRQLDVKLGGRVFIVGPNASGKSNLLDVFRFLRDISKSGGGLQSAIAERGGLSRIRCLGARKEPDVEISVELATSTDAAPLWTYEMGIKQQVRGKRLPYLSHERVRRNGEDVLIRPDEDDLKDDLRLTQTHLEQVNSNAQFRVVADFFLATVYLHLIPQLLRHPEQFQTPETHEDPFGRKFLDRITRETEKTRRARLKNIEKALRLAVPNLRNLSHVKDELGIPHLEAIYEHWRPNAGKPSVDQFSDGTLRLLALLWILQESDSLLLLEEPELSLHPAIVRKLAGMIQKAASRRKRQVLVSTHSPDLLADRSIAPEETLVLTPEREGTTVRSAETYHDVVALMREGLSVGEAVLPKTEPKEVMQLSLLD